MSAESPSSVQAADQTGRLHVVPVDVRRFPWIRRLAGDYAFNFKQVEGLYAGNPTDAQAWRDAVARAQRHRRDRTALVTLLNSQQEQRGAPPEARAAAAQLAEARTVAVVTGQQAGAFGGPLFTLLKALTALQLAERTRSKQDAPAVAVFWVDAEDHDWEEVRRCTVLDADFRPRAVTLADLQGAGELPIASLKLDGRIEQSVDQLAAVLPKTEFTNAVVSDIRASWRPGVGMGRAFATWLEGLLGPYGLVVFESDDAAAKPLVADVFARELASAGRTAALAAEAGRALAARGHAPQVVPQSGVSLFSLDGGRRPIRRQGDAYLIGDRVQTIDDLSRDAAARPAAFSPNVLLRPIVQDTLFPTIAYVAGPSELAYLGQLRAVYDHFGVPMPLMFPRASATLLDSGAARFIAKYSVSLEDLQPQDESALNRLLQAQLPPTIEQALHDAAVQVKDAMTRVIETLPALDPTLAGAAKTTLGKMEHELGSLHGKVIQAAKRRDETLRRQFTRAQAQAFPQGQPQERTLAVIYFLTKYGPGLVSRLLEDLPLDLGNHWIVTV